MRAVRVGMAASKAAASGRRVSSWLAEQVKRMRRGGDRYEIAMARKPRRMEWIDGHRPTREELHDRAGRP